MVAPDVMIGASFLILFTMIGFQLGFVSVLLSHIAFSDSNRRLDGFTPFERNERGHDFSCI